MGKTRRRRPALPTPRAALSLARAMPKQLSRADAKTFFARLAEARPHPTTELEYKNPFTLLVAVVLSAQATDAGVNKATKALFTVADTPEKMLALGEEKLGGYVKTIGLWRGKTKNVIALSKILVDQYGGDIPRERAALEHLPGVGRKTANVVLNVAFGEPTIAVDTHIFRVANRTGLAHGKTPLEVELGLEKIVPAEYLQHAHHWLILHGRYVCKARKPECWLCPVADICLYTEKETGEQKPAKPAVKKPTVKLAGKPKLRAASAKKAAKPAKKKSTKKGTAKK